MRIRSNQHTMDDLLKLEQAQQWLGELPILIDDERKMTISALRAKALRCAKKFDAAGTPIGLVVVDYLQKIRGRELVSKNDTRATEIEKISEAAFHLSEDLGCSVLMLAQENAAGQVRESRGAEFEATCVWQMRGAKQGDGAERSIEINIPKQRKGPTPAKAFAHFYPQFGRFTSREEWQ